MKRTDIINRIVDARGYVSYLEIGLGNCQNFNHIHCPLKYGVAPPPVQPGSGRTFQMTSDEYFDFSRRHFDFIFIDGLHHANQVLRDVDNALQRLSEGGTIMVHDCNPPDWLAQVVPRRSTIWTGNVWRAWLALRARSDIHQVCIDEDYGCGIITSGEQSPMQIASVNLTYENLERFRSEWLNLISWKEYERRYL